MRNDASLADGEPIEGAGEPGRMSRRSFVGRSAVLAASLGGVGSVLAACGGGSGGSGGTVSVLGFESYIDPTIKKLWAKAYPHITLQGTPAADDSEILTKIRAGGASAYDVVFSDFGYCPIYHRESLVETLDLKTMSAAQQLYPQFRNDVKAFPYLLAPDQAIGFPCEWAPTAMTFNTTVPYQPSQPYSWQALFSSQVGQGKAGFEGLPPEGFIATAALAKGFPASKVYSLNASELASVVQYFRQIRPFHTYNSDPETQTAIRTGNTWIAVTPTPGFASKINQDAGKVVSKSVVPKEGSVGFIDGPMLVKNATNRKNGLTFINWFAGDPAVRDYIFTAYRAAPCSKAAVQAQLAKGGASAALVKELKGPQPEIAATIVQGQPPVDPKAYAAAWDAILA